MVIKTRRRQKNGQQKKKGLAVKSITSPSWPGVSRPSALRRWLVDGRNPSCRSDRDMSTLCRRQPIGPTTEQEISNASL
jgi:hypothetical protein